MTETTCRSCSAPILWCQTTTARRMPMDAVPNPAGLYTIDFPIGATPVARYVGASNQEQRYTSHFASCPQAARWRK